MRCLALLLVLVGCEPIAPPSEADLQQTIEATPEPEQRLILLEVHVTRNPDSANGHLWLARAYKERKDPKAIASYERAMQLDPKNPIPRIELAYLLLEPAMRRGVDPAREDLDRAGALAREAVALEPTCEYRHHLVGIFETEIAAGYADADAEAFLAESIAACADPDFAVAWGATLGRVHGVRGKPAEAEAALCGAVLAGNRSSVEDCLELGFARTGKDEDTFAPTDAGGQLAMGVHWAKKGDTDAAREHFDKAAKLAPKQPAVWLELAELHLAAGRRDEACAALGKARAANGDPTAYPETGDRFACPE